MPMPFQFLDANPLRLLRDGRDLYLCKHIRNGQMTNTGVFLIRKSEWSEGLLRRLRESYLEQGWNDGAALLDLLGYYHLLHAGREPGLDHTLLARIRWLDLEWNGVPGAAESPNPVVVHYAGHDLLQRLAGRGRLSYPPVPGARGRHPRRPGNEDRGRRPVAGPQSTPGTVASVRAFPLDRSAHRAPARFPFPGSNGSGSGAGHGK